MKGKNITYNDISVWSVDTWGTTLCAWVNGELIHRRYVGYSKQEMRKAFYTFCNSL